MTHKLAHPSIWFQVNSTELEMNSRTGSYRAGESVEVEEPEVKEGETT